VEKEEVMLLAWASWRAICFHIAASSISFPEVVGAISLDTDDDGDDVSVFLVDLLMLLEVAF
jgi:hypothetical protein